MSDEIQMTVNKQIVLCRHGDTYAAFGPHAEVLTREIFGLREHELPELWVQQLWGNLQYGDRCAAIPVADLEHAVRGLHELGYTVTVLPQPLDEPMLLVRASDLHSPVQSGKLQRGDVLTSNNGHVGRINGHGSGLSHARLCRLTRPPAEQPPLPQVAYIPPEETDEYRQAKRMPKHQQALQILVMGSTFSALDDDARVLSGFTDIPLSILGGVPRISLPASQIGGILTELAKHGHHVVLVNRRTGDRAQLVPSCRAVAQCEFDEQLDAMTTPSQLQVIHAEPGTSEQIKVDLVASGVPEHCIAMRTEQQDDLDGLAAHAPITHVIDELQYAQIVHPGSQADRSEAASGTGRQGEAAPTGE